MAAKRRTEQRPSRRIAVRTELVKEFLVNQLHRWVVDHYSDSLPSAIEGDLSAASGLLEATPPVLAARLARAGFLARAGECALFEVARDQHEGLAAAVTRRGPQSHGTAAERSLALAAREPTRRPDPDDRDATTWRVPGPGGHVRHYVALAAIDWSIEAELGRAAELPDAGQLKRCWVHGFLLHCHRELGAPEPKVSGTGAISSVGEPRTSMRRPGPMSPQA